jgi:hypothetical protein
VCVAAIRIASNGTPVREAICVRNVSDLCRASPMKSPPTISHAPLFPAQYKHSARNGMSIRSDIRGEYPTIVAPTGGVMSHVATPIFQGKCASTESDGEFVNWVFMGQALL